jgi:hypothetical protein
LSSAVIGLLALTNFELSHSIHCSSLLEFDATERITMIETKYGALYVAAKDALAA